MIISKAVHGLRPDIFLMMDSASNASAVASAALEVLALSGSVPVKFIYWRIF